jgi:tetratricopeptide (TPR) repeat protein
MRTGENQKALDLIHMMESGDQNIYPFLYMNYLHGECLLRARRFEESIDALDLFTTYFRGENYIKDAWRKKAWAAFMLQDSIQFLDCLQEVKEKGSDRIGIDQEALAEAENNQYPNRYLLLSRILFDGGYYSEALQILHEIDTLILSDEDKVSYIYRIARVHHQMNDIEKAKIYYKTTFNFREVTDSYCVANAALKLGEIYEAEGNLVSAKDAYALCLSMDYQQYRYSINRRAREGLKRVSDQ